MVSYVHIPRPRQFHIKTLSRPLVSRLLLQSPKTKYCNIQFTHSHTHNIRRERVCILLFGFVLCDFVCVHVCVSDDRLTVRERWNSYIVNLTEPKETQPISVLYKVVCLIYNIHNSYFCKSARSSEQNAREIRAYRHHAVHRTLQFTV